MLSDGFCGRRERTPPKLGWVPVDRGVKEDLLGCGSEDTDPRVGGKGESASRSGTRERPPARASQERLLGERPPPTGPVCMPGSRWPLTRAERLRTWSGPLSNSVPGRGFPEDQGQKDPPVIGRLSLTRVVAGDASVEEGERLCVFPVPGSRARGGPSPGASSEDWVRWKWRVPHGPSAAERLAPEVAWAVHGREHPILEKNVSR